MEDPDRVLVAFEVEVVDQPPRRQQGLRLVAGIGLFPRLRIQPAGKIGIRLVHVAVIGGVNRHRIVSYAGFGLAALIAAIVSFQTVVPLT